VDIESMDEFSKEVQARKQDVSRDIINILLNCPKKKYHTSEDVVLNVETNCTDCTVCTGEGRFISLTVAGWG
jgi:ferredoxin-like protein FixX